MRKYMRSRKINHDLQRQILDYYIYVWDTGNTRYHKELFDQLPQQLRALMQLQVRTTLLSKVPMFEKLTNRCISAMLDAMHQRQAVSGEIVVSMGETATSIFFVEHGKLSCTIQADQGSPWIQVATIRSGHYFGELGLFGSHVRSATVEALTYSELQMLMYHDIYRLRKLHRDLHDVLTSKSEELSRIAAGPDSKRLSLKRLKNAGLVARAHVKWIGRKASRGGTIGISLGRRISDALTPKGVQTRTAGEKRREKQSSGAAVVASALAVNTKMGAHSAARCETDPSSSPASTSMSSVPCTPTIEEQDEEDASAEGGGAEAAAGDAGRPQGISERPLGLPTGAVSEL